MHVSLSSGEDLWFQASIAAAQEFVSLIECYRASIPRKKTATAELRTVNIVQPDDPSEEIGSVQADTTALETVVVRKEPRVEGGGLFDDDSGTEPANTFAPVAVSALFD